MSNQLIKTTELGKENVFPRTRILDLFDDTSGLKLIDILKSFNMMFVPYLGNKSHTRNQISPELRRQGLWLTYVINNTVYTEWYDEVAIDDTNWGSDSNWRQGSNALVGDLSVSPNGTWVINGEDSGIPIKGDKGDSPVIRIYDNKILVSYDKGVTYENLNNTPVYTKFRFNSLTNTYLASYDLGANWLDISDEKVYYKFRYNSSTNTYLESIDFGKTWSNISAEKVYYQFRYNEETNTHLVSTDLGLNWTDVSSNKVYYLFRTNDNRLLVSTDLGTNWENCSEPIAAWFRWADTSGIGNIGKVLISRDLLNWSDLSPVMTNNLYIKGYVATIGNLPSNAAIGDIYMIGPTYDESDITLDYPHYRMWVKQSSGWVDNGEFTNAGPVSTSNIIDEAVTINKLAPNVLSTIIFDVSARNNDAVFESLSALLNSSNLSTLIPTSVRHGGMSIRFIQGSDNKYVQYRLMADKWSTNIADWQGVDDEPTAGSDNLVKSGGVFSVVKNPYYIEIESGTINSSGIPAKDDSRSRLKGFIPINSAPTIKLVVNGVVTDPILRYYREEDTSTYEGDTYTENSYYLKFTYASDIRNNVIFYINDGVSYNNNYEFVDFASKEYVELTAKTINLNQIAILQSEIDNVNLNINSLTERTSQLLDYKNATVVNGSISNISNGILPSSHAKTVIIPINPTENDTIITVHRGVLGHRFFIALSTSENPTFGESFSSGVENGEAIQLSLTGVTQNHKSLCVFFYLDTVDINVTAEDILANMMVNFGQYTGYVPYKAPIGYNQTIINSNEISQKTNLPISGSNVTYGNTGQVLSTNGDGTTQWIDVIGGEDVGKAVTEWLDKHPEATTTVEDNSLTLQKFTIDTQKQIKNNYVTPQMFGAIGNGETDDSLAFQNAINFISDASNGIKKLLIPFTNSGYKINNPIQINTKSLIIEGSSVPTDTDLSTNTSTKLIAGTNNMDALICLSENASSTEISNLQLVCKNNSIRAKNGILYNGNTEGKVVRCKFSYIYVFHPSECGYNLNCVYGSIFDNCGVSGGLVDDKGGDNGTDRFIDGAEYGFLIANNPSFGMTSNVFTRCSVVRCKIGWCIGNITYSSMVTCTVDDCYIGYQFESASSLTLTGCGSEKCGTIMKITGGSRISIIGLSAQALRPKSSFASNGESSKYNVDFTTCIAVNSNAIVFIAGYQRMESGYGDVRDYDVRSYNSNAYISIADRGIESSKCYGLNFSFPIFT